MDEAPPTPDATTPEARESGAALPTVIEARVQDLEAKIAKSPGAKALYLQLAQLHQDAGRRDLAIVVLNRCLAMDPSNVTVRSRVQILMRLEKAEPPPGGAAPEGKDADEPEDGADDLPPGEATRRGRRLRVLIVVVLLGIPAILVAKLFLFASTRRLLSIEGEIAAPSWSPDGSAVAYVAATGGEASLNLYDLRKGQTRRLTTLSGWTHNFRWSPDGQKIAYESAGGMNGTGDQDDGEFGPALRVLDVASGTSTTVAHGDDPQWAPNGVDLAFSAFPKSQDLEDASFAYDRRPIALVNVVTKVARTLTRRGGEGLSFSPAGDSIAFEAHERGGFDAAEGAWVEARKDDLASIAESALSTGAKNESEAHHGFSRELESRAHDRQSSELSLHLYAPTNIYAVDVGNGHVWALTTDRLSTSPLYSPDGEKLLYVSYPKREHAELWIMDADGTDPTPLLGTPSATRIFDPAAKMFLPDRRHVLFTAIVTEVDAGMARMVASASPADLFLAEIGKTAHRVKSKHSFKQEASLSPDGGSVVYVVRDPDANKSALYILKL